VAYLDFWSELSLELELAIELDSVMELLLNISLELEMAIEMDSVLELLLDIGLVVLLVVGLVLSLVSQSGTLLDDSLVFLVSNI